MSGSRAYALAVALLAAAMATAAGAVAAREWFSGDDFAFLARVRAPDGLDWRQTFLPVVGRFWPFYRPLGMDAYFAFANLAFGLWAPGYFAVALAAHFAQGPVTFRLARQLGCDARAAAVGGLLCIAAPATLGQIFCGTIFHYVAASLAGALCVSLFIDSLRGGGAATRIGAQLALAVALLCSEFALSIPVLLLLVAWGEAGASPGLAAIAGASRPLAPYAKITAAYLVLRFVLIAPVELPPFYNFALGARVLTNSVAQLTLACGGAGVLAALAGLLIAGALAARGAACKRPELVPAALLCGVWVALVIAPLALLPFPHERFSIPLGVPLALLAALALTALARACVPRARGGLAVAALLLPALVFPWPRLRERAQHPEGAVPRRLVEFATQHAAELERSGDLVVLFGVEGLASPEAGERFRQLTYNGFAAVIPLPQQRLKVRIHDLNRRVPRTILRPASFFAALRADLTLGRASPSLLARELPRSLAGSPQEQTSD